MTSITKQSVVPDTQTATAALRGYPNVREASSLNQQKTISNQTVQRLLRSRAIQARLTVSTPNDAYEREADQVADRVMRMPDTVIGEPPSIQRACSSCGNENDWQPIQRVCKECNEELTRKEASNDPIQVSAAPEVIGIQRMCGECEEELNRKERDGSEPDISSSVESQIRGLQGGGEPLPQSTRSFFEPRFGRDFGDVRVHADRHSAETAQSVNALAYTRGSHIVFGSGQYQPNTPGGRRLLAHELTHVVQQGASELTTPLVQRQAIRSLAPSGLDRRCDLRPNEAPAPGGISFLFGPDSSTFTPTPAERTALTTFIDRWHQAGSFDDIRVQGFASTDGEQPHNWILSCQRAEALRAELIAQGISAARITTIQAHGESTMATTPEGNRRAVVSLVPRPTVTPSPITSRTISAQSCPESVSLELSRGNDDQMECQYQDAVILATIEVDPCACVGGGGIPITIKFHALLDGKSFADAAGTRPERQASRIGQTFFLREEGTANDSTGLRHSGDIGRTGDPDDTLDNELLLLQTIDCQGGSNVGRVLITNGRFIQQIITWTATASSSGLQAADIDVEQRQVAGRVLPPLRNSRSPYPPFPGVPRDNRCTCHPVTGIHQGTTCPSRFLTGRSVGGP